MYDKKLLLLSVENPIKQPKAELNAKWVLKLTYIIQKQNKYVFMYIYIVNP